jgi:hypothetical protein
VSDAPRAVAGGRLADEKLDPSIRDANAAVDFAMLSCQKYEKRDDAQGYHLYDSIRKFAPHYYLSVGDNVYYDSDYPVVNSAAIARYHWDRMFSLPRVVECTRMVPGYWLKDDHDSYSDDDWPGFVNPKMLPFFRLGIGGPVAGGRQYMPWIHAEDIVELYLAALDDAAWEGAINACAPEPVTNTELRLGQPPLARHQP